jgi:hypothetical protein
MDKKGLWERQATQKFGYSIPNQVAQVIFAHREYIGKMLKFSTLAVWGAVGTSLAHIFL